MEKRGAGVMTYEELNKTPEELAELIDKDNKLISQYAEENERLKKQIEEIKQVAFKIHNAVIDLDSLICL